MKNFLLPAALFITFSLVSCSKDQTDPIAAQDSPEKAEARLAINTISNSLLSGIWCITTCTSNSTDFVSQYKAYCFRFATNNALVAVEGERTGLIGNWAVSYVDGKARVSFSFLNNTGFEVVNGSWTTLDGCTDKKVVMQAVSDKNNYLTFEHR